MLDPKTLDDLAQRLAGSVPSGVRELQQDLEKNLRATLQASLARLDLVTREEFDAQREVLARTRSKLQALERQMAELEARVTPERATATRPDVENDMDGG